MATTRRDFLKRSGISAVGLSILPRHVLGGPGYVAPSDRVNIGAIGVGGRGRKNVNALLQLEEVQLSAIADPAEYWDLANFYYRSKAGRAPVKQLIEDHYSSKNQKLKVAEYSDFRKMLEQESSLDGILCSTPDHTHAYVSLMSMNAGKHVYCEKPLTHNIWEAREVRRVATETSLATQMGNQLHSSEGIRKSVEYLRSGILGEVREIHAWVPASRWIPSLEGLPKGRTPLPAGFDWDLWLGPRPYREFHEHYAPVSWRDFWEFGCGAMGDFGCHDLDAAVWAFDLEAPESVELFPAGYSDADIVPYGEIGYYHFPAKKGRPPIQLTWYSGGLRPSRPSLLPKEVELSQRGAMYVGEKGIMLYDGSGKAPRLFPEQLQNELNISHHLLPPTHGHHRDWINAIKGGPAASSHFEYASRLTEITLLGVLSLRMGGKKIYWDAKNMKAIGMPEAEAFIRESVRDGWGLGG